MAEELRRKIQLHKKGDKNDQWIPLNTGSCVQLTDYKNDGVTSGAIKNAVDDADGEFDDLNTALMKLENRKPNKEELADVAFSGDYNDLENTPDIQSVQSDWEEEDTESTSYIQNKPNLHSVATSGDYDDLENKPTIPIVNDSVITLTVNGETFNNNTFSLNQNSNGTIDIPLPSFMRFITTITSYGDLPSATKSRVGNTYKVASEFTYNTNVLAKVGDLFICANPSTNVYEWVRVPSGDENYARVANGVDGLCPALPNDNTKFLNGVGNWAVPIDTNTTYTMSFSNGVLTLTPSEGQSQSFTIPNDNTTYSIGFSNGVLTLTPSSGQAQTINIPNDNTTYTMSFANGVLTLTPSSGQAQTINIPDTDTKVTSSANHYAPTTDNNSDMVGGLASGDSVGSYTPNTNYDVVTGVKAKTDGKGHITDLIVTKQTIKDTDTNNHRAIKVNGNGNQTLAADSNADVNFANGNNVAISENNGTITIGVSATDHYITSGDLSISSGVVSFAITSGNNYFVGTSADVSNLSTLTTLNITINSNSNGACESNVFFKAGANFALNFFDGSNNALSVKVIGDEPEYESGGEYLMSYYKGTIIFGVLSARTNNN